MIDQQLHDAIYADATAKALADAGNDAGCAARMQAILPPTLGPCYVNERGVFAAIPDPTAAEAFMQGLEAVAAGNPSANPPVAPNPVIARALKWMATDSIGIDVSFASVRGMLDQLAAAGALNAASVATIKALAQQPAVVTADDVSRVWAQYRPNGQITGRPS
jgi:hypothetical protein